MKNLFKVLCISLAFSLPVVAQVQTPNQTANLNQVDKLTLENAFLKAQLDLEKKNAADQAFQADKTSVNELVRSMETKYNATFNQDSGQFILKPTNKPTSSSTPKPNPTNTFTPAKPKGK